MHTDEMAKHLRSDGYTIGTRDPRINTDFPGIFMCVEPFEDNELPTRDGSNGPWAIVGDDLDALIVEAYEFLRDMHD